MYALKSIECFEKVLEPIYRVYEEIIIQSEKQKAKKSLSTINMYFQKLKSICKRYDIKLNSNRVATPIHAKNTKVATKDNSLNDELNSFEEDDEEESEPDDLE